MPPYVKRISDIYDGPSSLVNGQPQEWAASSVIITDWGTLKVVIDGVDVTNYRGVPVQVKSWSTAEPFGYKTAVIAFPQITPFEELPAWLERFADVQIILVRAPSTGGTEHILWRGMFVDEEDSISETGSGLTIQCVGALYQVDFYLKKPQMTEVVPEDIYTILQRELDPTQRSGARWGELNGEITGVEFQIAGSWEKLLTGFIQELLHQAYDIPTGNQLTLTIDETLVPHLIAKDRSTIHWKFYVGQPGITHDFAKDYIMSPNAFYGEGVDKEMCHWRNTRYPPYGTVGPNGPEPPFFQPLIEDTGTNKWEKTVDTGEIIGLNDDWDNEIIRLESYQNFGSYISKAEAAASAAIEYDRRQARYTGTITLKKDPEEGSRFEMFAGNNIQYRGHRGVAARMMHIVEQEVDWESMTQTITVDEEGADFVTLAAILERDRSTTDPALRKQTTYRNSRAVRDQKAAEWDCESGAGVVPSTVVSATTWTTIQVPAGTAGSVINTLIETSPAAAFAIGVFDRTPPSLGDPFQEDDFWDQYGEETGLIMAWGAGTTRAGYSPGSEGDEDSVITGVLQDDASWYYRSIEPPWIYLKVYSAIGTTFTGLMRPGADY